MFPGEYYFKNTSDKRMSESRFIIALELCYLLESTTVNTAAFQAAKPTDSLIVPLSTLFAGQKARNLQSTLLKSGNQVDANNQVPVGSNDG